MFVWRCVSSSEIRFRLSVNWWPCPFDPWEVDEGMMVGLSQVSSSSLGADVDGSSSNSEVESKSGALLWPGSLVVGLVLLWAVAVMDPEESLPHWSSEALAWPEDVLALSPLASCSAAFFLVFSRMSSTFRIHICLRRSRIVSMSLSKSTATRFQCTNRPILTRHSPSDIGILIVSKGLPRENVPSVYQRKLMGK